MTGIRLFIVTVSIVITAASYASQPRSKSALAKFQRQNPCPANGAVKGVCPGWVKDHVVPLCAGGADSPSNLQWQTVADARRKDVDEMRLCAKMRSSAAGDDD